MIRLGHIRGYEIICLFPIPRILKMVRVLLFTEQTVSSCPSGRAEPIFLFANRVQFVGSRHMFDCLIKECTILQHGNPSKGCVRIERSSQSGIKFLSHLEQILKRGFVA